jgi:hypothetical protein
MVYSISIFTTNIFLSLLQFLVMIQGSTIIGFHHLFTNIIYYLSTYMSLLREVKGTSYVFVGYTSSIKLGIPTQLVVHSLVVVENMSGGGLATCICCMYGFHHKLLQLLLYFLISCCFVLSWLPILENLLFCCFTLNGHMNIDHVSTSNTNNFYFKIICLFSMILPPLFLNMVCISPNFEQFINCGPLSHKYDNDNLIVLKVHQHGQ